MAQKLTAGRVWKRCREPAAEYVQRIAQAHNLDGQPREVYERLAKDCKSNIRMMLQRVEDGEMLK